jgi:ABC-type methionine transport system permease subunit
MFDLISLIVGASSGFILGIFVTMTRTGQIKEENEKLNAELHKLTDRDSRGRFKGGK